ncbi:MAG: hypothetical protein RQ885_11150 [Desulfurococcales archaeon]|nr:hypothetical protein [Desulfurococcales archaeon]
MITRGRGDEIVQTIMHRRFYQAIEKRGYSSKYYLERLSSLEKLLVNSL